ncbi:MAG: Holliday junction branch migration protein RuvA [Dysgonamonadaceae bacterium]|jgi:Holliday junction DNA helicase RuvA|nr:Holliday junction branch migration protein RuvA [Dysgonamonadaceae bacterium]
MYDFIEGRLEELDPISATVQTGSFGYLVHISLNTFTALQSFLGSEKSCKIYLHQVIREDAQLFYGFSAKKERALFRLLITVSGVGAGTARMILSSLSAEELQKAIAEGNAHVLKNVKGIGLKTAQRIIVDLKDKIGMANMAGESFLQTAGSSKEEASSALINLGFTKASVEKALDKIVAARPSITVEELIKEALKAGI